LINAQDITQLIAAFKKRKSGEIILPEVGDQRGNPIVMSGVAMNQILDAGKNMVCRKFIDSHPEMVDHFQTENEHFIMDVDSLDDLVNFEKKTGWKLSLPNLPNSLVSVEGESEPVYRALQRLVTKC
jgi:CTP:molybdopterin cytidylyltransferase MocA